MLSLQIQFSIAVLAVLSARHFMKKMPKIYSYALWIVVFARLVLPFSIELEHAVMPQTEIIHETDYGQTQGNTSILINGNRVAPNFPEYRYEAQPGGSIVREKNDEELLRFALIAIWFLGTAAIVSYNFAALWKVREKVRCARHLRENIYVTDASAAPFTIGMFQPKIYLPEALTAEETGYIICHEQIHAKRKDNLVKNIAFLLTALYWWNPFTWTAFHFLEQDMEMSCDEAVLREMGGEIKRQYSQSLLNFAAGQKNKAFTPLTFGEVSVKQRVRNVLRKTKAGKWIGIIGGLLVVGAAVLIFTEKKPENEPQKKPPAENGQESKENIVWESNSLDIDGNGIEDYAAVEIVKEDHGFSNVLTVTVDSGESYEMRYSGRTEAKEDFVTVKAGKLRFTDRDSIVIEITDSTSNYGSTDIHILSMTENGGKTDLVEEAVILDGMTESADYPLYKDKVLLLDSSNITFTPENELLQYRKNLKNYAVQIEAYDSAEKIYLYWDGNKWKTEKGFQRNNEQLQEEMKVFVKDWAEAFCRRDREYQIERMQEPLKGEAQKEYEAMENSFGWSSPWPFGEYPYTVDEIVWETQTEAHAVIRYYAITSVPDIWVWREELELAVQNDEIYVSASDLEMYDEISTKEQFCKAYPQGRFEDGEYRELKGKFGEIWNQNALGDAAQEDLLPLLHPGTAAAQIFHLSKDYNVVWQDVLRDDGKMVVTINFPDGSAVSVTMMQPFGEDGIWIPEKADSIVSAQ